MWSVLTSSIGTLLEHTHNLLPKSMGGLFSKKRFSWGTKHLGKLIGGCSTTCGTNDGLMQRKGEFHNAFSNNLNTISPKVFPKHGGIEFILEVNS